MRLLKVIRQSSTSDDAASPETQSQALDSYAASRGWDVIGEAVDLDTSASIPPRERPELGSWLAEPGLYDALAVWRLDRLARSTLDFAELLKWAESQHVAIVSVSEGFDLSTPVGRMTAQILTVFAEFELASIRQRTKATRDTLRRSGRFPGGRPPYGYRAVKRADGAGWTLEADPETAAVVREMADRLAAGESAGQIAADLNQRGIPSPDKATGSGKERNGWRGKWVPARINRMLTSYAVLGYVLEGGQPVLDEEGRPVTRGPALIERSTFRAVRQAVEARRATYNHSGPRTARGYLLTRIAVCAECGRPVYVAKKNGERRWRCQGKDREVHSRVPAPGVRAEDLEEFVETWFLKRYGRWEWATPQHDPGEDHSAAIEEVSERIATLRADRYVRGLFSGERGDAEFSAIMATLEAERERLEALPVREAGTRLVSTGRTVAEEWERRETAGRAAILEAFGVRVVVRNAPRGTPVADRVEVDVELPEELLATGTDDPLLGT